MLNRAALDVLAHAAEIGLPEAVHVPAAAYDPILRPLILKRVKRALLEAGGRTTRPSGDHVLRLAFLLALPAAPPIADPNDDRAVAEAFDRLARPAYLPPLDGPRPERGGGAYRATAAERDATDTFVAPPRRKRKFWPATTAAAVTLLFATFVTVGFVTAPYWLPTPMARFAKTPFGTALGEPLTDAIVSPNSSSARAKLTTPKIEKQIGAGAAQSLQQVLTALPEVRRSEIENPDEALAPIFLGINDVNDKLVDAHVPALLHTYASGAIGKRGIWITSYFVERREDLRVDGMPLRSAWGRRMDRLNLADNTLYKGDSEDWLIVSLDHVDEDLVQGFLTQLAQGKPMLAGEFASTQDGARGDLMRKASVLVSGELSNVAHVSAQEAQAVHEAIAARNDMIMSLGKMSYTFQPTSRIKLPPTTVASFERATLRGGYEAKLAGEVLRIDERMKVVAKPLARAITVLAEIEEEEFAFRLAEQTRLRTASEADDANEADDAVGGVFMSSRTRAIAAAQLATLAQPKDAPRLALWLLVRRAVDAHGTYADAASAVFALNALLDELGTLGGKVDHFDDALCRGATAALEADPARIRDAASRAYAALFKRPTPAFTRSVRR